MTFGTCTALYTSKHVTIQTSSLFWRSLQNQDTTLQHTLMCNSFYLTEVFKAITKKESKRRLDSRPASTNRLAEDAPCWISQCCIMNQTPPWRVPMGKHPWHMAFPFPGTHVTRAATAPILNTSVKRSDAKDRRVISVCIHIIVWSRR